MKKMLFLLNPYSGQRKANKVLVEILEVFNQAGYDVNIFLPASSEDGRNIVMERAKDVDLVVCCGGDGTFNTVLSGLIDCGADVPLGYIPAGSTNDFAVSMNLPGDPIEAARAIVAGVPTAYDVGRFGKRVFSYIASFGAFTKVSYSTPQYIKNTLGHAAYVLAGIQELSAIRKEHVRMVIDGEVVEDDFLFGAICNSTSVGGVLTLDPTQVDMQDGLLEILLLRAPKNLLEIAECIQAVQTQSYNDCAMITFRSAREIQITTNPDMLWTLDGEREEGHDEITVVNQHLAYKLMKRPADD